MILTIKDIRKIICEEIDSTIIQSPEIESHAQVSDDVPDEMIAIIGETISSTSQKLLEEVEENGSDEQLVEFFFDFIHEADRVAKLYDITVEGQVNSAIAAASYFETNIDKFPPGSKKLAQTSIDMIRNNIYETEQHSYSIS